MGQSVLDVLIFLFEHYMEEDVELALDRQSLTAELKGAGFDDSHVDQAFDWLQGLASQSREAPAGRLGGSATTRVFSPQENDRLDLESRGFLMFLEQMGVLNAATRELVIDRVMALGSDDLDVEQLKWVVLMVLFNQPGQEEAFVWMENLVMDDMGRSLH